MKQGWERLDKTETIDEPPPGYKWSSIPSCAAVCSGQDHAALLLKLCSLPELESFITRACSSRQTATRSPCALCLGLKITCYNVTSLHGSVSPPGLMLQYENGSNRSLWIIVFFWIGGNGIIDNPAGPDSLKTETKQSLIRDLKQLFSC